MRDYVARYTDHVSMRMSVVIPHHETTSQHIYPAISLKRLQQAKIHGQSGQEECMSMMVLWCEYIVHVEYGLPSSCLWT